MIFKLPSGISKDQTVRLVSTIAVLPSEEIIFNSYTNNKPFSIDQLLNSGMARKISASYLACEQLFELDTDGQTWFIERTRKGAESHTTMSNKWLLRMLSRE